MKKAEAFPAVPVDKLLKKIKSKKRWQVLCGDKGQWRVGIYSPEFGRAQDIEKFERHSCPEFFILIKGRVSLALLQGGRKPKIKTVALKPFQPILIKSWHCGFCPDGPFTGMALVVERDTFKTWYRPPALSSGSRPASKLRK